MIRLPDVESFKIKFSLFFAIFLWASAFVGIRVGLIDYSPGALALFRFLIASVCMALIYIRHSSHQNIAWKDRLQLSLLGVLGIGVYNVCLNYGEVTVSAGIASFVIGLMPALTVMYAVVFLGERPGRKVYAGLLISLSGLALMIAGGHDAAPVSYGVLIIFVATIASVIYNFWQKTYLKHYHPAAVTAWIIWGGTASMMIFAQDLWQEISAASMKATGAVIYLGVFPAALAYLAWSYVLKALSASRATLYLYSMPVISSLLGFLLLHEKPTMLALCGGVLALIGAFYSSRGQ